eukprot:scaffold6358_cov267-Pinguiococcus_pyrenoidosus.AAC.3
MSASRQAGDTCGINVRHASTTRSRMLSASAVIQLTRDSRTSSRVDPQVTDRSAPAKSPATEPPARPRPHGRPPPRTRAEAGGGCGSCPAAWSCQCPRKDLQLLFVRCVATAVAAEAGTPPPLARDTQRVRWRILSLDPQLQHPGWPRRSPRMLVHRAEHGLGRIGPVQPAIRERP